LLLVAGSKVDGRMAEHDLIVMSADWARDPQGTELRACLEAHFACERVQRTRRLLGPMATLDRLHALAVAGFGVLSAAALAARVVEHGAGPEIEGTMLDIVFVASVLAFFAVACGYTELCDRL